MSASKQTKIGLFIIALFSIILVVTYLNNKSFYAKFHNKTGEDIDSLVIAGTFIGSLKKGESTEYISFKEFNFDGSFPDENISALLNNKKVVQLNWSDCGTGSNTKTRGSYIFDLKKDTQLIDTSFVYLTGHNQKIFWEKD